MSIVLLDERKIIATFALPMPSTLTSLYSNTSSALQLQECSERGLRYAMAILHNHSDSEEAVQEIFLRLHRRSIAPHDAAFRGVFFKSLRNHCIDLLRKRRVRNEVVALDLVESVADQNFETLANVELRQAVLQEIDKLPDSMQQALLMRIHGQLTYAEIAAALDATHQQIRTWIYRARRQLESGLRQAGFFETDVK